MNNYRRGAYSDSRRDGQAGETGPLPSLAYLADWPATRRCRPTSPAARKMSLFTAREKQSIYDNLRPWFEPADRRCPASRAVRSVFLRSLKFFFSLPLFQLIYSTSPTARRLAARMEGGALLYLTRFLNAGLPSFLTAVLLPHSAAVLTVALTSLSSSSLLFAVRFHPLFLSPPPIL